MNIHTLPNAIQREREALLRDAVEQMKIEGYRTLAVQDLDGYAEPAEVLIPILNVHMQPDIMAANQEGDDPLLGLVEVSTDLGEEMCGRRWQAFDAWAKSHHGMMRVFVHPEDMPRAMAIAQSWHMQPDFLVPLQRLH